jgi:PKD repeat protein
MNYRLTDVALLLVLVLFPLCGAIQACSGNGPINPGLVGPAAHNKPPNAVMSIVGDTEGPTPFTLHLDASSSTDPDGDTLICEWQFSDDVVLFGPIVDRVFESSGRYEVTLTVRDPVGVSDSDDPRTVYAWGLANSAWPKFAHDERNSGFTENEGPMMDLANADTGGAWHRYWRSGVQNDIIRGICITYGGDVIYAQGPWLRARTADGTVLWDRQAESDISAWPAILHDGSIVVATETGNVHRLDPQGKLLWSVNVSTHEGMTVNLDSAVNASGDGIYVGGYLTDRIKPMDTCGRLVALDFDGGIRWTRTVPFAMILVEPNYTQEGAELTVPAIMVPGILPSGNVVINGLGGRIFTPDGQLVAEMEYLPDFATEPEPFGPPSIDENGQILFTCNHWPVFSEDGSLRRILDADWGVPGPYQAAARGPASVDFIGIDTIGGAITLSSRTYEGDFSYLGLATGGWKSFPPIGAGLAVDRSGRTYVAAAGLHAVGPVQSYSVSPYFRRYSLWSYHRYTCRMTAPVIGENGWLYLGYGTDIMALGD